MKKDTTWLEKELKRLYDLWKETNNKDMVSFFEVIAKHEGHLTTFLPSMDHSDGFTMLNEDLIRTDVIERPDEDYEELESLFQYFKEFECECGSHAIFNKDGTGFICEDCGKEIKPFKKETQ